MRGSGWVQSAKYESSIANDLQTSLETQEEVCLGDLLPKVSKEIQLSRENPSGASPKLEITANTFYRMFTPGTNSTPERSAASKALVIEELTLGDTRSPHVPQPEDHLLTSVRALCPGTWVELRNEDDSALTARFSHFDAGQDTFVFCDRNGRKIAERTTNGLITEFRRGTVRRLAEPPGVLDKAFTRLLDPSTWRSSNR